MKKLDITIRDVLFFFLGVLVVIMVDLAIAWKDSNRNAKDGLNRTLSEAGK